MRSTLAYTSARMLLLVAALVVFYLLGARGLTLLVLALLASGIVSFVVLSKARDRMSASLSSSLTGMRNRVSEFGQRIDEGSTSEDED
jgi:Mn2+/Fe2+ NRAMP family transporter